MGLPLDQLAAMAAQPRQQSQQSSSSQKRSSTALAGSQGSQGHGPRIVPLAKGAVYVGAVDTRGRPHGEGELLLRDGSVHAGHFAEGAAHGEGASAEAAAACALRVHPCMRTTEYVRCRGHARCTGGGVSLPAVHLHQASTSTVTARCTAAAG